MSIRLRLTLLYSAILAVTMVAFGSMLYLTQERTTYTGITANLVRQASFYTSRGEPRPFGGQPGPSQGPGQPPPGSGLPSGTLPGRYTQTRSLAGDITGQTLDLSGATLPLSDSGLRAVQGGQGWYEQATVQDERLMIYSFPIGAAAGTPQIVQVAQPIGQAQQYLSTLRLILLVGSSVALVVAFILGWLLAGTALRPIHRITSTARAIGAERDFSRRVAHKGPSDEVGQLAITFNEMLAQLESGYRQIEEALKSQRRFVADASHELRTPLTTVRGNMELLRRTPPIDAGERTDVLSDTSEEVDRLIRLVNQLLVLARADAGQTLEQEEIAVGPLLDDVVRQARMLAPKNDLRCQAEAGALALGNRDSLKQVLLILVDNALVHTPTGTPVELAGHVLDGRVAISVRDSGPGIPSDVLPHIFERFYRGDESRTGGGAGLGLSIARELIEAQGGEIAVESAQPAGTVFTVLLPSASALLRL